ncbi:hypothetical protein BYZ73_12080 [Rhodovulum viride]|uniref:AB hydrolase-1 domain-containing protein n=1 Tax=Rhodovulum viride TaxID=1231134 RepID=A0ABX9DFL9_9RHOB|nr:alpha/beta fold hydrolase [Rhodovulum viride]RAP40933.1 hypothetical protein BYZ73_12080 [Rhodovulum viride]
MPLVQVNAAGERPEPQGGAARLGLLLDRALAGLPPRAPVAVLIHGLKFSPSVPELSPHRHILALDPEERCWKAVSWPRALGFTGQSRSEGLCIAFGWESGSNVWRAYDEAARAGVALARLIEAIRLRAPDRRVDLLGHSLGARVALSAMAALSTDAVGHAVLMAPAEFASQAQAALRSTAGRRAKILNVTSGENDLYDWLLERFVARRGDGPTLGRGLGAAQANWADLRIDDAPTLAALAGLGHRVAPPDRRICHWSPYVRPGMLALYAALIRGDLPYELLRTRLPEARAARWSRLLALPRVELSLPFAGNAPS